MGIAAGTAVHAAELFGKCQPILGRIPIDYKDNFLKKLENANQMAKTLTEVPMAFNLYWRYI